MLMPRKSWGQHPEVQANPYTKAFAQGLTYAVDNGADLRLTGKSGQIGSLYEKAYQDAIFAKTSAADALKAFVKEANKILAGG